ncbi:MAG: alpha/beta fold hydrolase [Acidimicrobiales bacterium]
MSSTSRTAGQASRFDVRSADGTPLAVWAEGSGPPLVMVHGSIADHTTLTPLVDALVGEQVATFSMDRRGFGASGDAPGYAIERDFEDVAAVVDAVAARSGGPVALFGHSYGANCAMGGAALTQNVHRLVLYEPSLGLRYPPGSIEAVEQAVAAGDMDAAVVAVFVGILEMTEGQVDAMRSGTTPTWATRVASAWTLPRECRVEESWAYQPGRFDAIAAPTLLLAGSETPAYGGDATHQAADAIPDARIRVLEGHGHFAHKADPAMVAAIIRRFIAW